MEVVRSTKNVVENSSVEFSNGEIFGESILDFKYEYIDTDITLDYLRNEGFSEEVLYVLDAVTRRNEETYNEFIDRIINNKMACYVKLADLRDNMDLSRIENPTQKDYERIEKYGEAVDKILGVLDTDGD